MDTLVNILIGLITGCVSGVFVSIIFLLRDIYYKDLEKSLESLSPLNDLKIILNMSEKYNISGCIDDLIQNAIEETNENLHVNVKNLKLAKILKNISYKMIEINKQNVNIDKQFISGILNDIEEIEKMKHDFNKDFIVRIIKSKLSIFILLLLILTTLIIA